MVTIVAIQIIVLPFTFINDVVFPEAYYKPTIEFPVGDWVSGIVAIMIELILPIAVLLISLVPVFAPATKVVKAKRR
jgi:hypothetical protein